RVEFIALRAPPCRRRRDRARPLASHEPLNQHFHILVDRPLAILDFPNWEFQVPGLARTDTTQERRLLVLVDDRLHPFAALHEIAVAVAIDIQVVLVLAGKEGIRHTVEDKPYSPLSFPAERQQAVLRAF